MTDQENLDLGLEELTLDEPTDLSLDDDGSFTDLSVDDVNDEFVYDDIDIDEGAIDLEDDYVLPASALYDSGHDYISGMTNLLSMTNSLITSVSTDQGKKQDFVLNYSNYKDFMEQPVFASYCEMLKDLLQKYANNPLSTKEAYSTILQLLYVNLRWSPGINADTFYNCFTKAYNYYQRKIADMNAKSPSNLASMFDMEKLNHFRAILSVNVGLFGHMATLLSWIDEYAEPTQVIYPGTSREKVLTSPLWVPRSVLGPYFTQYSKAHPEIVLLHDTSVIPKSRVDAIRTKAFSRELQEMITSTERLQSWGIASESAAAFSIAEFLRRALNPEFDLIDVDEETLKSINPTTDEGRKSVVRIISDTIAKNKDKGTPFLESLLILISTEPVYQYVLHRGDPPRVPGYGGNLIPYIYDFLRLKVTSPELCNPIYYASITYRGADDYVLNVPCDGKLVAHETSSFLCSAIGNGRAVFVLPEYEVHKDADLCGMILPPDVIVNALKTQFTAGTTKIPILYKYTLTPSALDEVNISVEYADAARRKSTDLTHTRANTLISVLIDYHARFYDHLTEEIDPDIKRTIEQVPDCDSSTVSTEGLIHLSNPAAVKTERDIPLNFYYPLQWSFCGTDDIPSFVLRISLTKTGISPDGTKILGLTVNQAKVTPRSIMRGDSEYIVAYYDNYGGNHNIVVPFVEVANNEVSFVTSDSEAAVDIFLAPALGVTSDATSTLGRFTTSEQCRLPEPSLLVGEYTRCEMPEHGLLLYSIASYICDRVGYKYDTLLSRVRRRIAGDLQYVLNFTMLDQALATQMLKTFKSWAEQPIEQLDAVNCETFVELYSLVYNDPVKFDSKNSVATIVQKIPEMMKKIEDTHGVQITDLEKLWEGIDISLLALHVLSKYDMSSEPNMQMYNALMHIDWCRLFLGNLEASMMIFYLLQMLGDEAYYLFYRIKKIRNIFKHGVNALNIEEAVSELCAIKGVPKCTLPTCDKVLQKNALGSDTSLKFAVLRHNLHRVLTEIEDLQSVESYQVLYSNIRKDLPALPQFEWTPGIRYEKRMNKLTDEEFNALVSKDDTYMIFSKYYSEFLDMVYRGSIVEAFAVSDSKIMMAYDMLIAYHSLLCRFDDIECSTAEFKDDFYKYCGCFALCYSQLSGAARDAVSNGASSIDAFRADPTTIPAWSEYPGLGQLDITDIRML